MKPGDRVIYRGAVHDVLELGTRYDEPWLRIGPTELLSRWVPSKHVRAQPADRERAVMARMDEETG